MWPAISNPVDHPNSAYAERVARPALPDRPPRPARQIRPAGEVRRTVATVVRVLTRRSFA